MRRLTGVCVMSAVCMLCAMGSSGEANRDETDTLLLQDRNENVHPCDWLEFRARATPEGVRLFYRCAQEINFSLAAAYCVFIDFDENRETGYRGAANNFPIGADYMLQGKWLYRCNHSGTDWSWALEGEPPLELNGDQATFTIPASLLPLSGKELRVFLLGDNTAEGVGGNANDEMPDGALRSGGGGKFIRIKVEE